MLLAGAIVACVTVGAAAHEKPAITYKVFQFPADQIPRIDGKTGDWAIVPESDSIATDQLWDDSKQNCYIFTPAANKDWCMAWSSATWIKELPWPNAAYDFKPGEAGKLTLEFWITPFDYAGPEGPQRAVESVIAENKIIGMGWAIIDYDDVNERGNNGFWNLSPEHTNYGHASQLCAFRLLPLEPRFRKSIEAQWTWKVLDMDRCLVAFKDLSAGQINSWKWDFGDGGSSAEQHPAHVYAKHGNYAVILDVQGPDGKSRRSKAWDVQLK